MVLTFAGGVSPPRPGVSLLFSVSYPQASRSYYLFFNYLFFNYLFFNYLYGSSLWYKNLGGGLHFGTNLPIRGSSLWYWKTPSNHRRLWVNLAGVVA